LLLFAAWTLIVRLGLSDLVSNPLDHTIRAAHSAWLLRLDRVLALPGTPVLSAAVVLVICAATAQHNPWRAAGILAAFAVGLLIEAALKQWLFYPSTGSYPSGHALRALFLAGVSAPVVKRRSLRLGLFALALAVGVSRVSVGDHYSDEVIGAWLLGWSLAVVALARLLPGPAAALPPAPASDRETAATR